MDCGTKSPRDLRIAYMSLLSFHQALFKLLHRLSIVDGSRLR